MKRLLVSLLFSAAALVARGQFVAVQGGQSSPYVLKFPTSAQFGDANKFPRWDAPQTWTGAQTFNGATAFGSSVNFGFGALTFAANQISWASLSKSGSSLADLATRSASDLTSGTVPDGRFPAALPALSGVNLTNLNASNLASGTIPDGRFPAVLPAAGGANLTGLNANNLSSGTVPDARFPATLPAASGANLTSLNAGNLSSGTVPDARFPATLPAASGENLTALNASNVSSGTLSVARGGTGAASLSGMVKGNGTSAMTAAVAGTDFVAPSRRMSVRTSAYTLAATDEVIVCNSASAFVVTIPAAASFSGQPFTIKNKNLGAVTIDAGSGFIDGVASHTIGFMESLTIISDGTTWNIISRL